MSKALSGSLDTNVLLRFLLGDVPDQHRQAKALINEPKIWHVSNLAIAEIVFVLESMNFTREEIKHNIDVLSSYTNLYIARSVIHPAMELYVSHASLSFVDACLAYDAAAEHALPLWTFDRKLARQTEEARLLTD